MVGEGLCLEEPGLGLEDEREELDLLTDVGDVLTVLCVEVIGIEIPERREGVETVPVSTFRSVFRLFRSPPERCTLGIGLAGVYPGTLVRVWNPRLRVPDCQLLLPPWSES